MSASSTLRLCLAVAILPPQSPRLPSSASPSPRHHHVVAIQARRVAVVSLLCVVAIQARRVTVVSLRGVTEEILGSGSVGMGSLGAMLKHPDDVYPLIKLKMAARQVEKQIPPQPHWGFCYIMLRKVSRSFALVIQQLPNELRDAGNFVSVYVFLLRRDSVEFRAHELK
nr:squalene synthase-like isoform X1 [Ipomoea batatas]